MDAFGKPESGIFESAGNLLWLGDYNECISTIEKTIDFKGKYCKISNPAPQATVSIKNNLIKKHENIFFLKIKIF